jgi:hypothetical protein
MPLFKYGDSLYSTETIAAVHDTASSRRGEAQIKIYFNGKTAPEIVLGTVDEFLAASVRPVRSGPAQSCSPEM